MDPLELLGNEIRIDVLRELAEANAPLSFTSRDSASTSSATCPEGYELGHAGTRVVDVAGGEGTGARDAASADSESETGSETSDATECPVCGDDDCEKLFHVHLTPPWE